MKLLAIDTASYLCSACVFDTQSNDVLGSVSHDIGRDHAEKLMDVIADALTGASLEYENLDLIVSTTGPGSFTGIRVGLATARGISTGLGVPVRGVSTLEAMALKAESQHNGPLLVVLDAKREEVFYQFFSLPKACEETVSFEPMITDYETLQNMLGTLEEKTRANLALCGSGSQLINSDKLADIKILFEDNAADIEYVARLGAKQKNAMTRPEPLYLREADAKPQTGFALPRIG